MGFLDSLKRAHAEAKATNWGKWCARVMAMGFVVAKNQHSGTAPTYAWLARKTLLQRNYWKQLSETDFVFKKSGEQITIADDMNLLQVIHIVIDVEYGHELIHLPSLRREELLGLAHAEAEKFVFSKM